MLSHVIDVWDILPVPPTTFRYVFAKDGRHVAGAWVGSAKALEAWARRYAHANCYIQLNPTASPALVRPKAGDVSHIQAILIDIDPVRPDAAPLKTGETIEGILTARGVDMGSVSFIDTGRGIQLWIHMPAMPLIGEGSLARCVRAFIRDVCDAFGETHGCVVDSTCSDLSRVARLPGTVNQKTGRQAVLFSIRDYTADPWFLFRYDAEPEERPPSPPESRSTWPRAFPHLTRTAIDFITEGVEQTRRHKCCYATARSLMEAGVPQPIATEWMFKGAERCDPPLEEEAVERIIGQVWARAGCPDSNDR